MCVPVILAPPDCCQISTLAAWAQAIPAEKSIHEKRFSEIENHAIVREVFFD